MAEEEDGSGVSGPSIAITSEKSGRVSCTVSFEAPPGVDLTPLLRAVATLLRASFAKNIDSGSGFAPLAKSTLRRKQLKGYPLTPLIASRLLRNSLAQSNTGGNVNRVSVGKASVVIGTNVRYAAVQQEGGGNGIPARPFIVVQKGDEAAIAALVASFNARLRAQQKAKSGQQNSASTGFREAEEAAE